MLTIAHLPSECDRYKMLRRILSIHRRSFYATLEANRKCNGKYNRKKRRQQIMNMYYGLSKLYDKIDRARQSTAYSTLWDL